MIAAVISDFGGVLTKPLMNAFNRVQDDMAVPIDAYGPAFQHSLSRDGVHPLFALERGEISEREFLARLERGFRAVLGREVSLHGFGEQLLAAMEPNQELFDHYAQLRRERSLRFALCTNNVREWESRWRALLPIDELFEVVVDSAFVGTRKPEPEIYAITLERLGVPAPACVFIDDLEPNVEAAESAGMHGIVHRDTAQTIAALESLL
ncbi:MAG TPA: HAD family phosphatase [Solirubrobacteraceae bacterium]|jgi:putative hydrolase of the HAD superfamily|nr:HAD family phosphatase [Solirubrobacteraceae bacterium]